MWDLGTGIFEEMDIVLGCLDNVETRMAVNRQCWLTETPWIDAGMNKLGLRVEFYKPPELPCYQCNLTNEQFNNVNKRYSCDYFKRKAYDEGKMPTTQIASAIVSALQVQECIKYICNQSVSVGKKIYFQGTTNDFEIFTKQINESCYAHGTYPNTIPLKLNTDISLRNFLNYISQDQYSGKGAILDFRGDRTFVKAISCRSCGNEIKIMRPTFRIDDSETVCVNCRNGNIKLSALEIETQKETQEQFSIENTDDELLNMSLHDLGVPYMHVVAVQNTNGDYKYFKLENDKSKILPSISN